MATNYYNSFVNKLKEIFMMDHAELDFGIYRIMNQKREDILHFLEFELLPQVNAVFKESGSGDLTGIKARLKEIEQTAASYNASPEANPEYQQLKQKLQSTSDTAALQNDVFSHLVTFFSRYYDNGDFVSKRRYKDNTYAIPYNGEEVKLHWANADQYYIKTSEYFRDYTFVLPESRKKVHFILKDASTEQNNNKAANNMERRFAIYQPKDETDSILTVEDGELKIFFTYELMPKSVKQEELLTAAWSAIECIIPAEFSELLSTKAPSSSNPNRTLLEKHLTDYTAKNSFDYFIHKDLGGFLSRELDFYIKNEVMHLDDLDVNHIQSQLSIVKAIKLVGDKIIRMLAQLENFQKRLWLKKKFVVQSDYCITLDRVPEELYEEILTNDKQREEWVRLFAIDEIKGDLTTKGYTVPLTEEFLKQNPFLVLDTAFFSTTFKHKLLSEMENIDEQCNGLLISSENFQALELLQEKYKEQIKCVYIDPPYNTGPSKIIYKNSFQDGSWLSLMDNRLNLSYKLIDDTSCLCVAIDDFEMANLSKLLDANYLGFQRNMIIVNHHPQGTPKENVSRTHEYAIILSPKGENVMKNEDKLDNVELRPLMRSGSADNNYRHGRWKSFYAILIDPITKEIKGYEQPPQLGASYPKERTSEGWDRVYPISKNGDERVWRISSDSKKLKTKTIDQLVKASKSGSLYQIITSKKEPINSNWIDKRYNAGTYGTTMIANLFGDSSVFSYPKSLYTVQDYIKSTTETDNEDIVLDFFAGSGTTGHAVIDLNRNEEEANRKYILCEMGNYFNTATKPRIQKVIYSKDWKNGKPISRQGISQCFKYMRLEQYEDTLNNLQLHQNKSIDFEEGSTFKESYMLGYMLDTETRDSLLNLKMFENPFAMTLKTTKDNELVETPVDMVETFNYLIGLHVETEDWYKNDNICVVQGTTHQDGLRTLVIWRNCKEIDNELLNKFFSRMDFRTRDSEFDLIYVNGDNTLPNLKRDEDNWKVVLIEEEFTKRMFEND